VKRHGWSLSSVASNAKSGEVVSENQQVLDEAFESFGDLFKDRVRECLSDPTR
jgi:hypothetical protein